MGNSLLQGLMRIQVRRVLSALLSRALVLDLEVLQNLL